jgi:hypothetical protein
MKTLFAFLLILGISAFLFVFAQHHVREENSFRACTLAEIYAEFFQDIPDLASPRLGLILLLSAAGFATAFYPAFLVLAMRYFPNASGWLILAGIIALIGTGVNFFVMILSHTSFGFGGASSSSTETMYFWLITAVHLVFAVTSIALGSVSRWANLVHSWLAT